MPDVRQAILDALSRGVEVNIYTNSLESIDEPLVGIPILESLPEVINAGAHVYLKQGKAQTLHSKFMIVDGLFATVGSCNIHPRSIRYDYEFSLNVLDRDFAVKMDNTFYDDISEARKINSVKELNIPNSFINIFVKKYFYNQLSVPAQK